MKNSSRVFRGELIAARVTSKRRAMAVLGALLLLAAAGIFWMVQPPLLPARRALLPERADPERLARHVETLAGSHFPRDYAHPERLREAAEYLAEGLRGTGAAVRLQEFLAEGETYCNVIATLGPDTPDRVVVGAHYDTDGPFPGADDNASGVAGLLELARLLAADPPSVRVELVAYCLEEMPFFATDGMGSGVHARSLRRSGARVVWTLGVAASLLLAVFLLTRPAASPDPAAFEETADLSAADRADDDLLREISVLARGEEPGNLWNSLAPVPGSETPQEAEDKL